MCDTILAPGSTTASSGLLFGKNSDRQRNEAQAVDRFPRGRYEAGTLLKCTYLTIPQVAETYTVLLSRPFWIWGAEMGANEHGVVIGNEGLHARNPAPQTEALTGMDLVRLALERAASAAEAVSVITTLLERFGQGGNCGHLDPNYYNNGFMICDATESFVLETVGREWLVERVRDVRSMSNIYSVGQDPYAVSAGLPDLVRESHWSNDPSPIYARAIGNPDREHIGQAGARRARSASLLSARSGHLSALDFMRILRDHSDSAAIPTGTNPKITLCMHAGGEDRPGQTVGSWVSELETGCAIHWVTATSAPCISVFKPMLLDVPLPPHGPRPTDHFDSRTLWWRHEQLHRTAILGDFQEFLDSISEERDSLEVLFEKRIRAVASSNDVLERSRVVASCWTQAIEAEDRWHARLGKSRVDRGAQYAATWLQLNRVAGLEVES